VNIYFRLVSMRAMINACCTELSSENLKESDKLEGLKWIDMV
jgi:hypothetical protein